MWSAGFSLPWLPLLQSVGSRHVDFGDCGSQALKHRLCGCGARAGLPSGMLELPDPGIEPLSPALAGRFFTAEPSGKPWILMFLVSHIQVGLGLTR